MLTIQIKNSDIKCGTCKNNIYQFSQDLFFCCNCNLIYNPKLDFYQEFCKNNCLVVKKKSPSSIYKHKSTQPKSVTKYLNTTPYIPYKPIYPNFDNLQEPLIQTKIIPKNINNSDIEKQSNFKKSKKNFRLPIIWKFLFIFCLYFFIFNFESNNFLFYFNKINLINVHHFFYNFQNYLTYIKIIIDENILINVHHFFYNFQNALLLPFCKRAQNTC